MIILGTNSIKASSSYDVDNSCRFNDDDSPKLNKTFGSASSATDRKKLTLSFWVKRCSTGTQWIFTHDDSGGTNDFTLKFESDALRLYDYQSSFQINKITNRLFRDFSAWYSIIVIIDTTLGTAADRVKIFVNGVRETSFSTDVNPDQDDSVYVFVETSRDTNIGIRSNNSQPLDGYLAEFNCVIGTATSSTDFGDFDSDTPTVFKPIEYTGSYGSNGFYLDFADSGNLGDDESGNGNDFTETNIVAADQATDTCTNNFAILNANANRDASPITLSEGNCLQVSPGSDWTSISSTLGVNKGKWWAECNIIHLDAGQTVTGIISENTLYRGTSTDGYGIHTAPGFANQYKGIGYQFEGWLYPGSGGSRISYGASYTQGDIINIALNLDDGEVTFYKNGVAASGGAYSFTVGTEFWFFAGGPYASGDSVGWNFGGCPPYSISSGNADENGYGNFEHAPPSGFLSLCTKNIATNGG